MGMGPGGPGPAVSSAAGVAGPGGGGTQPLSHYPGAPPVSSGPHSSLSQLAAMTQAPRATEAMPPGGPPGPGMAHQRPGMRPAFMPGQGERFPFC